MTEIKRKSKKTADVLVFFAFLIILIFFASQIKSAIIYGIKLSVSSIIPSLFPFMILSDYLVSITSDAGNGKAGFFFEKIFGISGGGLTSFICGAVCGFPLGISCAKELHNQGSITKSEFERLSFFVNNPSLAFTVCAVGLGMRGSLCDGLILYFSVLISAVFVGLVLRSKREKKRIPYINSRQSFDLVSSIKNAAYSSITISSYVIFFSAALGVISTLIKSDAVLIIASPFLEVGSASKIISEATALPYALSMALSAFALGFSGFSVHLQAFAVMPPDSPRAKYLLMKLLGGVIAFFLALVISLLI